MSIFSLFKKSGQLDTSAHQLLLTKFEKGLNTIDFEGSLSYWQDVIDEPLPKVIKRWQKDNLIREASSEEALATLASGAKLKKMLSSAGLTVSGKKSIQAHRLVENQVSEALSLAASGNVYTLTETGLSQAKDYRAKEKERETVAFEESLAAFDASRLKDALATMQAYNQSLVFSPGLNVDWGNLDTPVWLNELSMIKRAQPGILGSIDQPLMDNIRRVAAISCLYSEKQAASYVTSKGVIPGFHLTELESARMLMFFARNQSELAKLKRYKVCQYVELITSHQHACSACEQVSGRAFKLAEIPEVPLPACRCERGCMLLMMPKR